MISRKSVLSTWSLQQKNIAVSRECYSTKILSCSVSCWKSHQLIQCQSVVETQSITRPSSNRPTSDVYNFLTEDTVSLEKLKLLEHNQELKNILCNRHLREMLVAVDKSSNPAAAMQQAMLEPIFVEFADECLKVVESKED